MLMLAECYRGEYGLDKDEHLSAEWIEKAVLLNCPGAMHKKAKQILKLLDFTNQQNIYKILTFFQSSGGANEIEFYNNDNTYTPGSELDQVASPLSTFRNNSRSKNKNKNKNKDRSRSPMQELASTEYIDEHDENRIDDYNGGKSQREKELRGEGRPIDRNLDQLSAISPSNTSTDTNVNAMRNIRRGRESEESNNDNDNDDDYYDDDYLNLESAIQLLLKSAELNFVAAKTDLGILHELAQDCKKAADW